MLGGPPTAKPVHPIIKMIKWIRTSRLSIKKSVSLLCGHQGALWLVCAFLGPISHSCQLFARFLKRSSHRKFLKGIQAVDLLRTRIIATSEKSKSVDLPRTSITGVSALKKKTAPPLRVTLGLWA